MSALQLLSAGILSQSSRAGSRQDLADNVYSVSLEDRRLLFVHLLSLSLLPTSNKRVTSGKAASLLASSDLRFRGRSFLYRAAQQTIKVLHPGQAP